MVSPNPNTAMQDRLNETYDRAAQTRAADAIAPASPWPDLRALQQARTTLLVELQLDAQACRMGEELTLDQVYELATLVGRLALAQLNGGSR